MIRVVLVDDHPLVRRGIRETLEAHADIRVVAEASQSSEVLQLLAAHPCDVLLLDLSLPGRGGLEVLKDVRHAFPRLRTLIVSAHAEAEYGWRAVRAGAAGYVAKASPPEILVDAIRTISRTGRFISEELGAALADFATLKDAPAPHQLLSDRELQVLKLLSSGKTVTQIAAELSLSVKTVSTYRTRLIQKLGLRTTHDVVRYAVERKLFE